MSHEPPYTVHDGTAVPTINGLALLCGITPEQLAAELNRLANNPDEEFPELWIRRAANTLKRDLLSHGYAGLLPATLDRLADQQDDSDDGGPHASA
ncbi:hypothetical protein [Nonomuraea sp. NPDC049646]|uniref:hypothetical protein n=1 Tax=unclassified Nonomuraea TaxID=2593643 RepID=UPI0037AF7A3F